MKIYRSKACIIYRELKLSRDFVPTENLQIISKIPGFQKKIYRSKNLDLSLLYYTVNIALIYRLQAILIKNIFRKKRSNTRGPRGRPAETPVGRRRTKTTCFHFCIYASQHKIFQGSPNFACIAFLYFRLVLYSPEVFRAILARSGASKRKRFELKTVYFRRKVNRGDFKKICFRPERK